MIKTNELRFGNLVLASAEAVFSDTKKPAICRVSGHIDDRSEIGIGLENIESKEFYLDSFRTIEPIPLTEEWLLRCGFTVDKYGNIVLPIFEGYVMIECKFNSFPLILNVDGRNMPLWSVKYLHQLQNLYHALTGKELEIKL